MVAQAAREGRLYFTVHAKVEMSKDGMTPVDVENVLKRGAILEEAELKGDAWRYRVHTRRFCVVVEIEPDLTIVVTAWRKQ